MEDLRLRIYTVIMAGLATISWVSLDWGPLYSLAQVHLIGLGALTVLALLSESLAVSQVVGRNAGNTSITFIIILACVLLFGPQATVVLVLVTGVVSEFGFRRKEWHRSVFNISQYVVSAVAAGLVFSMLGGAPSPEAFRVTWIGFFAFGLVLIITNQVAVSIWLSVQQGLQFERVFSQVSGRWGISLFYDFLVSPLAIGVAYFYSLFQVWGLLLVLFPLFFIRRAYLVNFQLQQANRDLLKVLIKAIETRDPYTSGHSLRVSALARRIAEITPASTRQIDNIETAALLHDIGKIEAMYADILMKPDSLTPSERAVIESHVEKGVDLLESLSSFKNEVIDIVRHHHERYDGSGYPSGLAGSEIPLGSRIIMICDAIDAMLSDRPYRGALTLDEVRGELEGCSGSQFDPELVRQILSTDILQAHAAELAQLQLSTESTEVRSARQRAVSLG